MDAFFNIGNLYFDLFSIIFIVLLLISLIVGAAKGFLRELLAFGKVFAVIAAAILLCKPFGDFIFNLGGIGNNIANSYESGLINANPDVFNQIVTTSNKDVVIPAGLELLHIPSLFVKPLTSLILPFITESGTVAHFVAKGLATYTTIAIAFVIIMILGAIIFALLGHLAKKVHNAPVIGSFDKILGLFLGAAICYLLIDAALFGLSFLLVNENGFTNWVSTTMYLKNDSVNTISKWMYENNLTSRIVASFIK